MSIWTVGGVGTEGHGQEFNGIQRVGRDKAMAGFEN